MESEKDKEAVDKGVIPVDTTSADHPVDINTTSSSNFNEKTEQPSDSEDSGHGGSDGKKKKEAKGGLKDYARIFGFADRLDTILYILSLGCSIGSGAALPLMTLVFGQFTTDFNNFTTGNISPGDFRDKVDHFVLYFLYLFAARFALQYISTLAANVAALRVTRSIRKAFLESTLRQEVWHFDQTSNGSAATQITTNGNRINVGISEKLAQLVQGLSLFFSSFVIALAVQWKLALITMTIIPALFLIVGVCISVDAVCEAKITKFYSQGAVLAQDAISSIRTIHAFGAHEKIVGKYDEFLKAARHEGRKKSPIYGILFGAQNFLVLCATALSFWQGYRMYRSGEIGDVGTVFTVVLSVTIATTSIALIAPQQQSIANAASSATELFETIDKPSLLDPLDPKGKQPDSIEGRIEVRNLSFAYPSRPSAPVLTDLSLSIPAGKTTALVGPSGCGKSTLIGLLERWYEASSGQVYLDDVELSEYNTKWLRSNIRLVQQEPTLYNGTVFENVAKGFVGEQAQLSREEQMKLVIDACTQSNAHDFISELPDGYDTRVGERASMLSGGQRQRVAIARSIISNPRVLLLDEATSALGMSSRTECKSLTDR